MRRDPGEPEEGLERPESRLRPMLVVRALEHGGAERQLVNLAVGLTRRGVASTVVVFGGSGNLLDELRAARLRVISLGSERLVDPGALVRLAGVIARERPDVLYSWLSYANLACLALSPLFDVPVVWSVRASAMRYELYPWPTRIAERLQRHLAQHVPRTIANSEQGRRDAVERGHLLERIVVVENGVDLDRFRPDPEAGARTRAAWGVPRGAPLLGSVARLDPMKDHETLLLAFARVAERLPEARLACVGTGPAQRRQALERTAERLGLGDRLTWAGDVDDVPAALAAMDVHVSSSSFGEGFSNALAEALACGVPCVATDVGDSARLVGAAGLVVRPGDPRQLAGACLRTLERVSEDRESVSRLSRAQAERHGIERMVSRTLEVLESVADAAGRRGGA